jgi:S-adenosyl-L-methionine hydrolase (adenosine-forming)
MTHRYITLLTDFGLQDGFVGVCHGVIRTIAPDATLLDITHGIAPQAVAQGAIVLARSLPYLPAGVHLAVVDPGVGGTRRAVAIRNRDGRILVGPDNGLLSLAAPVDAIESVRALTNTRYHLENVSRTFHARDLFAPVSAHLAVGAEFDDLGDAIEPATLVRIELPEPEVAPGAVRATVLAIDRFGNLELNVRREHVDWAAGSMVELRFALNRYYAKLAETYADASRGDLILYEDSYGVYSVAISDGNAAQLTGVAPGEKVQIRLV